MAKGAITTNTFTVNNVLEMFDSDISENGLKYLEKAGHIPEAHRVQKGKVSHRAWNLADLPKIGERIGYLKKPPASKTIAFYTQKGGTGKTPIAFNLCRALALHNISVLLIGLDSQETITKLLMESRPLQEVPQDPSSLYNEGIYELSTGQASASEVIKKSNIPTLDFLPENAGLPAFEHRLYTLPDPLNAFGTIIKKIREHKKYDYIIFDCNPAWNRTINSVLHKSDVLVSPIGCNESGLSTPETFYGMLDHFDADIGSSRSRYLIPTLLKTSKFSKQVKNYFRKNYSEICSSEDLKDTVIFDEAQFFFKSVSEYAPSSPVYKSLISVFREIQELSSPETFISNENELIENQL